MNFGKMREDSAFTDNIQDKTAFGLGIVTVQGT